MPTNQVKSKQRVKDHGEVFTPDFIVNDMLDLVKNETERIESRFLEPACGDGNFLAPILERRKEIEQEIVDMLKETESDFTPTPNQNYVLHLRFKKQKKICSFILARRMIFGTV